jgi:adiponectin receptor
MDTAKQAASEALETTKKAEKKLEQKLTYLWHEIDTWQQDNHYIISGYRPQSNSYLKSYQSLGYLHNETVNIYTHLLGAIFAFISSIVLYRVLEPRYDTATREDVWVFSCFFLGAIACLGMSATFHTISNHSHAVAVWGNQLDYAGIVFLIWGSFIPVLYYGFQQDPELMRTYWGMVSKRNDFSVVDIEADGWIDYDIGGVYFSCLHASQVPHSSAPTIPRTHVRAHGLVSCIPNVPWHPHIRSCTYAGGG